MPEAVIFYEKPGCLTNARQKALLERNHCRLTVRSLLSEPWTEERLYAFLERRPVAEWFNPAAPAIKSGEIDPRYLDKASAMALLLRDPILIRRPLLDTPFGKTAGFDDAALLEQLGVQNEELHNGLQVCSKSAGSGIQGIVRDENINVED
jgi:nitrogenase-associated protein